jgi:hypothetical protein
MDCYIVFTKSQHGHHAHVIVTHDPCFATPEERFDQLGPLQIESDLSHAEVGERIAEAMSHWLAQPANAKYLERSARPVAVFHDGYADDLMITLVVPRHVVDCIAAALYNPANPRELPCKAYTLDPLVAARLCR